MDQLPRTTPGREQLAMLEASRASGGRRVLSFTRGAFVGLISVAAIAVWAINLEVVLAGNGSEGSVGRIVRLVLCDAIPLATLCAIYRGVGHDRSLEGIVRSILGTVFWFGRRRKPAAERHPL